MSQPTRNDAFARRTSLAAAALSVLVASFLAAPAWAANVVKIRVGTHPTFTRVVFELDSPAGYRVEEQGTSQLVVTLDANSRPRSIRSKSAGVAKVDVVPGTGQSVAHIALRAKGVRKDGVRLKEMILANPPRIVLDLMRDEPVVAKKPVAKPKIAKAAPKPAPKIAKAAPKPAPKIAKPEPKPAPKIAKPAPKPAPKIAKPEPKPAPKIAKAEPKPAPAPEIAKPEPAPKIVKVEPTPAPKAAKPEPKPPLAKTPGPKRPPVEPMPTHTTRTPEPPKTGDVAKLAPKPILPDGDAEPKPATASKPGWKKPDTAKPAAPKTAKTPAPAPKGGYPSWLPDSLSNPILLGGAGGVLLCLIGFVLLMRRRRPLPVDLDVDAIGDSEPAGAGVQPQDSLAGRTASSSDSTSFSDLFDDEAEPSESTASPAAGGKASADRQIDDLFSGADAAQAPTGDTSMSQATSDLPADPGRTTGPVSPPSAGASSDGDVLRVVHELERRMQQLEGKLKESNEARERLERQVAAQSEELRVQRAAIARTQRALRTMSRGDGEDKATEPALRDGDTQARTRVVE